MKTNKLKIGCKRKTPPISRKWLPAVALVLLLLAGGLFFSWDAEDGAFSWSSSKGLWGELLGKGNLLTGAEIGLSEFGTSGDANSTTCGNVTGSLTLTANITTTGTCFTINASNLVLNCAGFTVKGDKGGSDYGVIITAYDNVTITNCVISTFGRGIYLLTSADRNNIVNNTLTNSTDDIYIDTNSANGTIYNNTFNDLTDTRGIVFNNGDEWNVTNNTFTGDFSTAGINFVGSTSTNNKAWANNFWGADGITDSGTGTSLCVNDIGNFYNGSVATAQVPAADCGPTPLGAVYVNQSANTSFTWNGSSATYTDLRTAVFNTWNGTNNTVFMLTNHSTATGYTDGTDTAAVSTVRNNININCQGFTFSDPTANSVIKGIASWGEVGTNIYNCIISNFDYGIIIQTDGTQIDIYNNTFEAGSETYGIYFSDGDFVNITNNTFTGDYATNAIRDLGATNTNIWMNQFWGADGSSATGTNLSFCVNGFGNFYNGSVATAQVPAADCGPTPLGAVYVNQSATTTFTWNGSSATYTDLRTAVFNTWNGTNNTVFMIENHSTTTSYTDGTSSGAVSTVRNNINLNCQGFTFSDPTAASTINGIISQGETGINIYNCIISNFNGGIIVGHVSSAQRINIYNNTFEAGGEAYGIYLYDGDFVNITNNTFTGDYANFAIDGDGSDSTNTNIWYNQFWGADGSDNIGTNDSFCVNDMGNFYNGSVATAQIPSADCGPTPFGAVYVNQSATTSFTWNGSSATYPDLRTAVFNTWNGTNNTVFMIENHSTTTSYTDGTSSGAVSTVRNNVNINCQGFTFSDPTAASTINGIISQGETGINIYNCIISNFNGGIIVGHVSSAQRINIYNNTFEAGGEAYGIYLYDGDFVNITNNTFTGDYANFAIDGDGSDSTNVNIWYNQFWGADGIDTIGINDSFCVNGFGNFYNGSVAIAQVHATDCGPTPNSNVSVNTTLTASTFTFSTATNANPIYKTLQEAYYNANHTIFLQENVNITALAQIIRDDTTLNCAGKRINSTSTAIKITGANRHTVKDCFILTSGNSNYGIHLLTSNGSQIINTTINTTGTTAYGVYLQTNANHNQLINITTNVPSSNDVYTSSASNNTLLNSRFQNRTDLGITGAGSTLLLAWLVNINVTDGTNPLSNATVEIYNFSNTLIYSGVTDSNGRIEPQTIIELTQNSSNILGYATPHNLSANKSGYSTNSAIINLTTTNSTTTSIALTNTLYPDLKINTTDIVYTSGTLKQNDSVELNVTVYNLGNANATNANISFYIDSSQNQSRIINLSDGTSQILQFNWTALGGNHTFEFKADPNNNISESNETNNNVSINLSIKYVAILNYFSPTGNLSRGKDVTNEDTLLEVPNTATLLAQVLDLFNTSHGFSANCSFYFNNSLLGTNLTNSSGHCQQSLDKTLYPYGDYNVTVNFTSLQSDSVSHTTQISNTTPVSIYVLTLTPTNINHYDGLNYMIGEASVINISIARNGAAYDPENFSITIRGSTDANDGSPVFTSTLYHDGTGLYRYASIINETPNGGSVRWRMRANTSADGIVSSASHSDITVNANDANVNVTAINASSIAPSNVLISLKDAADYELRQESNNNLNWSVRKGKNHTIETTFPTSEKLKLSKINLNQSTNLLQPQLIVNSTSGKPSTLKNFTSIVAFESFNYSLDYANITLPKNNQVITSIWRCSNWNATNANCSTSWTAYSTTINENATHIWFNVTSFSGYAGGIGFNANLTIWDQTDSSSFYDGGNSKTTDSQVIFYTNYTNSTSGLAIPATCNITFNVSPAGPFNMTYNFTLLLYTYNRSFSTAGNHSFNISCANSSTTYDALTASDNVTILAVIDNPPQWSSNWSNVVISYSSTNYSLFNITWVDDYNVSTIYLESNYSGIAQNYSMNIVSGNSTNGTYNYSAILPVGSYYWKSHANDSANQFNSTIVWNFTITQAASSVNLTINSSKSNFTINNGTSLLLNCSRINGESSIYLYNNGTLINSGSILVTNLTQFNSSGTFNITCAYNSTQNYSSSAESYWITVALTSDSSPSWQNNWSSIVSTYSNTTLSKFNISWNDDYNVSLVYSESNYSGAAINYTMILSVGNITNGTYNYSAILPAGSHYWKSHARDNSNQWNSTLVWNFTITQSNSSVNLTIAGSKANASITAGDSLNLSCTKISGESNIYLYREGTLLNSGTTTISNLTVFSSAGAFNITCSYNSTQNNSANSESYWVIASAPAPSSSSSSSGGGGSSSSSSSGGGGTTGEETTGKEIVSPPPAPEEIVLAFPEKVEVVSPEEVVEYVQENVNIEVTPIITIPAPEVSLGEEALVGKALALPKKRTVESRPLVEPENVRIVIENKGDKALVVAPELVRITPPLEREEKVESRIEDQLKMELEEKEEVISPEDLQKKVEERLEFARLREKEKVALFSEAKQSVLLGGTSKRAWFIAEKEPITGKLLQSQVEKRNITVLPGERKETELKITPGITKELKVKEKIRLVSGDQIAFEKEVEFSPEKRLGTAAAVVDGALEIYAVILSNPEQQKYSLEIRILHIDNTTKTKESVFEEVYGPYLSPLTEGIVLTQKLIPGPLLVRGDYLVKATLYGELTAEQEIPVRIDVEAEAGLPPRILSVERRALAQQVNVSVSLENNGSIPLVLTPEITSATTELPTATTAAAQERISQTISKKALAAGLSLSEKQKEELLNEQLETLKIMEKEKVLPLEPARQTRFFSEEILLGMEPSAEMPTGSALKTKFETTPLILQPGEKISSSLKVTPGISAQAKPRKEKIILASANGEKIQKEVEIIPEARLGTIVESSGDALDLYLIVPAHPEAGKQTDKYSLELDILKEDNLNQKMVFSELYGPYTVSLKKGGMFAQQLRSNLEEGEYLVKTRVYQRGYIAAEQEFKVNLTARELPSIKEVSLPLTGKAYAPAEKVNISRWLILVLITLVVGILLGGSYYALATRRVLIAPVKLPERAIEKPIQRVYEETVAVVTKIKAEPQLTREIEQLNQQLEKLSSAPERIEQARIVNTPRSPVEEIKRGESKPLYKPISIIPLKVTPQRIELEEELFRVKAELAKVEQTMPEPVRVITKAAEKEKKSWWKRMFLK